MTDQFLSIDPMVDQTDQPYVFTNDNPLNSSDPLGLIPYLGKKETNRQVANVGLTYAITTESNQLNALRFSLGNQVNSDYWNWQAALDEMSANALSLQRQYEGELSQYVNAAALLVNAALTNSVDLYQVTSSYLKMTATAGTYVEAYNALQPFIGTGGAEEAALGDAMLSAETAAESAAVDFIDTQEGVILGGGYIGAVWSFVLLFFGDD